MFLHTQTLLYKTHCFSGKDSLSENDTLSSQEFEVTGDLSPEVENKLSVVSELISLADQTESLIEKDGISEGLQSSLIEAQSAARYYSNFLGRHSYKPVLAPMVEKANEARDDLKELMAKAKK